jgi:hypothetical protein
MKEEEKENSKNIIRIIFDGLENQPDVDIRKYLFLFIDRDKYQEIVDSDNNISDIGDTFSLYKELEDNTFQIQFGVWSEGDDDDNDYDPPAGMVTIYLTKNLDYQERDIDWD